MDPRTIAERLRLDEGEKPLGGGAARVRLVSVIATCELGPKEDEGGSVSPRAKWLHGVEWIAGQLGADPSVEWRGNRAWMSFGSGPPEERIGRAWRAAKEIWTRGHLELDAAVRVAVVLGPGVEGGQPAVRASEEEVERLLACAPERSVVVNDDVALSLEAGEREGLGVVAGGQTESLYVYPADAAGAAQDTESADRAWWSELEAYALSSDVRKIPYVGFRLSGRAPPSLELQDIFVPPSVVVLEERAGREASDHDDPRAPDTSRGMPIQPILARYRHIVVLGEPGAGKTTLLRWLAIVAAQGDWPALTGELGPRLPLLLSMGRLAEELARPDEPVLDPLIRYLDPDGDRWGKLEVAGFLEKQLDRGRCLVLLDGFDEVRAGERRRMEEWLSAFGARYPRNVYVSTSRFVGYAGLRVPEDAALAALCPFDEVARERFVRGFCRAYVKWESGEDRHAQANERANALLAAIAENERLGALASNPFMLSALALIHRAEGRLPRHRVQAYEVVLRTLCETWAEARRLVPSEAVKDISRIMAYEEEAIPVLGALALAMHRDYPRGVAPTEFVRGTIARALEERDEVDAQGALEAADAFLKLVSREVQVFLERGSGQWGFSHLTFQEFFVAAGLHASEQFEEVALAHLLEPRWEEILRLGVGYLALVQKRPVAAHRFVERVLRWEAPEPWTRAVGILGKKTALAALLAMEAGDALPGRLQRKIAEAFAEWFCEGPLRDVAELYPTRLFRGDGWLRQMALSDLGVPVREASLGRLRAGTSAGKVRAAFALNYLPPPLSTADLVAAIEQGAPAFGIAAMLGRCATSEELVALMEYPDEHVRAAVVESLDQTQPGQETESTRARVLAKAAGDPSTRVRELAAMAGPWRPGTRVPALLSPAEEKRLLPLLREPSERVRLVVVPRLGESEQAEVVSAIERMVHDDPSEDVRRSSLLSWVRQGGARAFEEALATFAKDAENPAWDRDRGVLAYWMKPALATPILLSAATSVDVGMRATAAFLLSAALGKGQLRDGPTRAVVAGAVGRAMGDEEASVRRAALEGAKDVQGEAMKLVESMTADADASVRHAAYQLLGRSRATASLASGLDDESPQVRAFCLAALPTLPPEEAARRLDKATRDESEAVREVAARFLRHAGLRLEDLRERLLLDPSVSVRRAAAQAVANHELPVAVRTVGPLLDESDIAIRRAAASALANAGDEGMAVLVNHAVLPEARAALWIWAERRGWVFRDPGSTSD